jgi:hypothetical protein
VLELDDLEDRAVDLDVVAVLELVGRDRDNQLLTGSRSWLPIVARLASRLSRAGQNGIR